MSENCKCSTALDGFELRVLNCVLRLSLQEKIVTLRVAGSHELFVSHPQPPPGPLDPSGLKIQLTRRSRDSRVNPGGAITKLVSRHNSDNEPRDKDVRLVVLPGARHIHCPPSALPALPQLPSRVIHPSKNPSCASILVFSPVKPRAHYMRSRRVWKTSKISLSVMWVTQ